MARELRRAAQDTGEDVAAHHGLVKMIPQWERGNRVPTQAVPPAVPEDLSGGPGGARGLFVQETHPIGVAFVEISDPGLLSN
jgi:hypothetical protein